MITGHCRSLMSGTFQHIPQQNRMICSIFVKPSCNKVGIHRVPCNCITLPCMFWCCNSTTIYDYLKHVFTLNRIYFMLFLLSNASVIIVSVLKKHSCKLQISIGQTNFLHSVILKILLSVKWIRKILFSDFRYLEIINRC